MRGEVGVEPPITMKREETEGDAQSRQKHAKFGLGLGRSSDGERHGVSLGGPVRGVLTAGLCRSRSYRTTWGSTLPASARALSSSRRRAVRPGPRGGRHGARCCANHASVRAQASPAARALYRGPVSLKKA